MRSVLFWLGLSAQAWGASPADFRWKVSLASGAGQGPIARLPLSREIIQASERQLSDIRVFDDQDREVPYVIHGPLAPPQPPTRFAFTVEGFQATPGRMEVVLSRPEGAGSFDRIRVQTGDRDFLKNVTVSTSRDGKKWTEAGRSILFDFSSRIALRDTTIPVPGSDASRVRLLIEDADPQGGSEGPGVELLYPGVQLKVDGARKTPFRIDGVIGLRDPSPAREAARERHLFAVSSRESRGKTTRLRVEPVNLPVAEVRLVVGTGYFHRKVSVKGHYRAGTPAAVLASGYVYRIPGMPHPLTTLTTEGAHPLALEIAVEDGDNPPLDVREVEVSWEPLALYFISDAARRYAIYSGGTAVTAPDYETPQMLSLDLLRKSELREMIPGDVRPNEDYRPSLRNLADTQPYGRAIFTIVVLLMALAVGIWVFALMRKLP